MTYQCSGITTKKVRCSIKVNNEGGYCKYHGKKARKDKPERSKWWNNEDNKYDSYKKWDDSYQKYEWKDNWITITEDSYDSASLESIPVNYSPSDLIRARKVKLKPTANERKRLKEWFGIHRYIYNKSVEYASNNQGKTMTELVSEIRSTYTTFKSPKLEVPPWLSLDEFKQFPAAVLDDAIQDFKKANTTEWAKRRKDPTHIFNFKFRRKKDYTQSMNIQSKNWNAKSGEKYSWLHNIKHKASIPDELNNGIKIYWDKRINTFYFIYVYSPVYKEVEPEFEAVSIDPGVRTFATCYNSKGIFNEYCTDNTDLKVLCDRIDNARSLIDSKLLTNRRKRKLQKLILRWFSKLRNKTRYLHYIVAKYLCTYNRHVILPVFETGDMVQKPRKIGRKTAREMLTYSHYSFQQRLLAKAEEYVNTTVHIVTEEYTTKYCGNCGTLNDIGASKSYVCNSCDYQCDRDYNAARNIMLKNMGLLC